MTTKESLLAVFEVKHAPYPQYKGYFDNAVLICMKKNIRSKAGLALAKGEVTIARREAASAVLPVSGWTAYSPRLGWNMGLDGTEFEVIG